MTIEFVQFRGQIVPTYRHSEIRKILRSLDNPNSYHANLQMIYNNEQHFQTVPFRVCNFEILQEIASVARSRSETIIVQGDVHRNFHASGIIINPLNQHKIPVYDTYISIKYNGRTIHILMHPPTVATPQPNIVKFDYTCTRAQYFIPPSLTLPE